MPLPQADFDALSTSLVRASDVLRKGNCLLQAVARRYYLVYTIVSQAAAKYGVAASHQNRGGQAYETQRFRHNEIADVVWTLYTGQPRGTIVNAGTCPGITGHTNYQDREAIRTIEKLHFDRKRADYGIGASSEPYDDKTADERLRMADLLAEDLRKLL